MVGARAARTPLVRSAAPRWAAVGAVAVGLAAAGAVYALVDYPVLRRLGATRAEAARALLGDDVLPGGRQSTRATTVDAPPAAVWPWLVQMGQDRAGFYSHDWLERLFGAEIRNADELRPEWQRLAVGDTIWPYPERKLAALAARSPDAGGWTVARLEPARGLVVRSKAGRWTWALILEPLPGGRTRLLARTRFARPAGVVPRVLDALVGQPAHLVMESGVLRGVKRRAERAARRAPRVGAPSAGARGGAAPPGEHPAPPGRPPARPPAPARRDGAGGATA
jgi:hypothetical protein